MEEMVAMIDQDLYLEDNLDVKDANVTQKDYSMEEKKEDCQVNQMASMKVQWRVTVKTSLKRKGFDQAVTWENLAWKDSQMADHLAYLTEKDSWKDTDLSLRKVETLASQMMKDSWMVGYFDRH